MPLKVTYSHYFVLLKFPEIIFILVIPSIKFGVTLGIFIPLKLSINEVMLTFRYMGQGYLPDRVQSEMSSLFPPSI